MLTPSNQTAKTYSVQTLIGAQFFTKDLKLGHYMKIPPRATFMGEPPHYRVLSSSFLTVLHLVQIVAAFFNCLVQMGTKAWLVSSVPDLCDPMQPDRLVCPQNDVFFNTSVIWYVGVLRERLGDLTILVGASLDRTDCSARKHYTIRCSTSC